MEIDFQQGFLKVAVNDLLDTDCTEVTDFSVTNGRKSVQSVKSVYEKKAWFDFKKAVRLPKWIIFRT
ncbi:MAG: hypothetical protein CNIPEHKO_00642 [Anaerolineales bacterium]|nr:hypothetical protein [Anaerolineales bacterium]